MRISDWSSDVCSSDLDYAANACTIAGDICFRARSEPWRSHSSSQPLDLLRRLVDQRDDAVQCRPVQVALAQPVHQHGLQIAHLAAARGAVGAGSEERRVGKEGVIRCRSRWLPVHKKKKK